MRETMDHSGGGGAPWGGDGHPPKPSAVRARPGSLAQGTLTSVPLALEEPWVLNEPGLGSTEPIPHELLQLWMLLSQREKWSSLVVVPAQPDTSGLEVGRAIVSLGNQYRDRHFRLIDAEGLSLGAAFRLVRDLRSDVEQGRRVVLCIDSVLTHPVGLEVALAAERALLCVPLGSTPLSAARRTLELIGKERFLGSVTLQPQATDTK